MMKNSIPLAARSTPGMRNTDQAAGPLRKRSTRSAKECRDSRRSAR